MFILAIDGADYSIAKDYAPVERLHVDYEPLHTLAIWPQYFSHDEPPVETPDRYNRPLDADYFWKRDPHEWTAVNVPISNPTFDFNAETPDWAFAPRTLKECNSERLLVSKQLVQADSKHTVAAINGLDAMQHLEGDMDVIRGLYEETFRWAMAQDPDVIISDHGFSNIGGASGEDDHGPSGIVYGLDVEKASEVGGALAERI